MSTQVKVEDLEVFRVFRAAMVKFAQAAEQSLSNADSQISRMHSWLENEQGNFWTSQLRKRSEAVVIARDEVRKKKLYTDFSGKTSSAVQEEKVLAQRLAAVEEAKSKIDTIRKSLPRLEKEADMYRGGIARLSKTLTGDVPNALALLDRLAMSLEQYMQIEAPEVNTIDSASAMEGTVSRGDGAGIEAPKTDEPPVISPADSAAPLTPKEGPMSLADSKGTLSKALKDLFARWEDVKSVWSDAQSEEFERTYLLQIQQDVRVALTAMDQMGNALQTIKSDCE